MLADQAGHGQLPVAYRVAGVRIENPTVRTLALEGTLDAAPGQFAMLWLPGLDEKPFSFSDVDPLAITVQRVGPFTTALHGLTAGDRVWLRGPFGRGFTLHPGPLLLVCGGCGAAPLRFLAQMARRTDREVHVVLGARTRAALFFQDRYVALGCAVHLATEDGSAGYRGTAIDLAATLLNDGTSAGAVYACGPGPMLDAAYLLAQEHGLPCQLSYEAYMRCGIGVCGSCAVGGCLVCRDGPVFDAPPALPP